SSSIQRHLFWPQPFPQKSPPNLRLHFRPCLAPGHGVPAGWRSGCRGSRSGRPRAQIRRNKWTARQLDAAVMEPGDYGLSGVRERPRPAGFAAQVAAARGAAGVGKRATPSAWIRRPAGLTAAAGG
ncbi:unnamed protein product, partial [Urochloa humidicola]